MAKAEETQRCVEVRIGAAFQTENQTCPVFDGLGTGWCRGAQVQKRALRAKGADCSWEPRVLERGCSCFIFVSTACFCLLCRNERRFSLFSAKEWYSENIIKLMISQIKYQILGVKLCLKNFFNSLQPLVSLKSVNKFPTSWLF